MTGKQEVTELLPACRLERSRRTGGFVLTGNSDVTRLGKGCRPSGSNLRWPKRVPEQLYADRRRNYAISKTENCWWHRNFLAGRCQVPTLDSSAPRTLSLLTILLSCSALLIEGWP